MNPDQLLIFPKPEKLYYIAVTSSSSLEEEIAKAATSMGWEGRIYLTSVGAMTEYEVEETRSVKKAEN